MMHLRPEDHEKRKDVLARKLFELVNEQVYTQIRECPAQYGGLPDDLDSVIVDGDVDFYELAKGLRSFLATL